MRVLRAWASRDVVGGIHEPCTTAARLSRPSPAEEALDLTRSLTARLEEMVDTGAR